MASTVLAALNYVNPYNLINWARSSTAAANSPQADSSALALSLTQLYQSAKKVTEIPLPARQDLIHNLPANLAAALKENVSGDLTAATDDALVQAIDAVVQKIYFALADVKKHAVEGYVYEIANPTIVLDFEWGKTNATQDTLRLIEAMKRADCLHI